MLNSSRCPNCGATNNFELPKCQHCGSPKVFKLLSEFNTLSNIDFSKVVAHFKGKSNEAENTIDSYSVRLSLGLCYLKQKLFPLANIQISKLIEDHSEQSVLYIYKSLITLNGKRPRTSNYKIIQEVQGLLNMAHILDDNHGLPLALKAIVEYDYFHGNGLKTPTPTPSELMILAKTQNLNTNELNELIENIGLNTKVLSAINC